MVIMVDKDTKPGDIAEALEKISKSKKKPINFYGKLKGVFGDGLEYQRKQRA